MAETSPKRTVPQQAVLVDCHELACTFGAGPSAVVAVHGVSVQIRPRDQIAVTGPSGSGKSTLLHLLGGLVPPTAGTISWPGLGGHPLGSPGRVGTIFQAPSLIPSLDVVENVMLPLLLANTDPAKATRRAHAALRAVDIGFLAARVPDELSGGQAQRVAVARALACRPRLILADEPTGHLDHATATALLTALLAACEQTGAALLISTHDRAIAGRLSRQWVMRDGGLVTASAAADPAGQVTR
ncbi:ABC transporter ATP-binding protein [Pseudofrankia sp. BMG5.36]|nr:ABC transporter ATP-binding protein [Pseudofrankia sp. BMG5.36]